MLSKKILIFGGSGYVGSKLIFSLLKKNFIVINYDRNLFGSKHLPFDNKRFYQTNGDVRDYKKISFTIKKEKPDTVIHLACISNDPGFLLNKKLSKEVNYDSFKKLMKISKNTSINKFIFASTCSVYGVSKIKNVTENHPLKPITLYNKYKVDCEKIFLNSLDEKFRGCIIRPATACGLSPKMRFDLTVNILTNYAFKKGFIKVFGGKQKRPNVHIDDMVRVYTDLCENNLSKINKEIFNVGFENLSINQIAKKVKFEVERILKKEIKIIKEKSNDIRSYHVNSDKIKRILNFKPKKEVSDAIKEICITFKNKKLSDSFSNINYFNVKKLKKINFK